MSRYGRRRGIARKRESEGVIGSEEQTCKGCEDSTRGNGVASLREDETEAAVAPGNVAIPHHARNMLTPITVHAKIQTVPRSLATTFAITPQLISSCVRTDQKEIETDVYKGGGRRRDRKKGRERRREEWMWVM